MYDKYRTQEITLRKGGMRVCKLVGLKIGKREIKVADIKKECIENIISNAHLCSKIEKIILFGSALEERCQENSDIDIAVFGKYEKNAMLRLKSYRDFVNAVVSFGKWQDYDVLYFDTTKQKNDMIMTDIENGAVLYERV